MELARVSIDKRSSHGMKAFQRVTGFHYTSDGNINGVMSPLPREEKILRLNFFRRLVQDQ